MWTQVGHGLQRPWIPLATQGCVIAPARNAFLTFACLERALFLIFMLSLLHEWRGWASDQQARGRSCCAVDLSSKPLLFQMSIDCCFFFYSSWVITLTPLSSTILHSGNSKIPVFSFHLCCRLKNSFTQLPNGHFHWIFSWNLRILTFLFFTNLLLFLCSLSQIMAPASVRGPSENEGWTVFSSHFSFLSSNGNSKNKKTIIIL